MHIQNPTAVLLAVLVTLGQVVAAAPEPPSYASYQGGSFQQLKARDGGDMTDIYLKIKPVPLKRPANLVRRVTLETVAALGLACGSVFLICKGSEFTWNRLPQEWTDKKEQEWADFLNQHPNVKWIIAGKKKYKKIYTKKDATDVTKDGLENLNNVAARVAQMPV